MKLLSCILQVCKADSLAFTKHYIYKCRIQNKSLNLNVWKNEIKFYLQAEKMKPIKNNTYEKFAEAWDEWLVAFEEDNEQTS